MLPRIIYTKTHIPNAPPDAIRLCSVVSELKRPSVRCELSTVELHKASEYIALSYAWRAPLVRTTLDETLHEIECNGETLAVHDNLFCALLRLGQPPYRGRLFWIDAICIDQENDEERGHQVDLMSEIYRNAKEVIIWLGPHDEHVGNATRLIQGLCLLPEHKRQGVLPHTLDSPEIQSSLQPDLWKEKYWIALAHLFRRTWFSRAWVIQEVLLARRLLVLCGHNDVVTWEQLEMVSHHLSTTAWRRAFADPDWLGFDDVLPHYNSPANLRAAKGDLTTSDALLRSLVRSRMHDCSERIDKVFCLYGIATLCTPHGVKIPRANYKLSESQAYTDAAINVLQSSSDLHILAHAEGALFRNIHDLPSWAPDWSVHKHVGIGVTGHKRYWAAGDMPKTELEFPKPGVLRLQAACVGLVTECGEGKGEISSSKSMKRSIRLLEGMGEHYYTGEPIMEAFWRTLLYDTGDDGKYPARNEIQQSFQAWLPEYRLADDTTVSAMYMSLAESLEPGRPDSTASPTAVAKQKHLFDHSFHFRTLLRMFRLDNGLLGLGTQSLMPGDSVWIVPGSRIPLAFRKKPVGQSVSRDDPTIPVFELVGSAYLHGLMHGQALEPGVPDNGRRRSLKDRFVTVDLV